MFFVTGDPESVGMSAEKIKYIKKLPPKWIEQDITPNFVGFTARNGVVIFHEAYGKLTPERDSPPIRKDTIFPLCSITKLFTSTAAMLLVEDGLLSTNRSVEWYLPEFTGDGRDKVMVHQLLTHTSGLQDSTIWKYLDEKFEGYKKGTLTVPDNVKEENLYLHFAYKTPLATKPGDFMSYCNFNMELLGEIIKKVSGCSLDKFYKKRIFEPLGMKDTYLVVPESVWDRCVKFPEDSEHGHGLSTKEHFNSQSPAGGAYSTVSDMGIFGQMMLNKGIYGGERILSPLTVNEMTFDRIPGISAAYGDEYFKDASWGLGWNVFNNKLDVESGPLQSKLAYGHGGAGRSMLWIDPVYKVVGCLFYVKMPPEFRRPDDLFRNAVMSSIYKEELD